MALHLPSLEHITISGGEIQLNQFPFSTQDYQPPQYPRSISYEDVAVSGTEGILNRRSVTDLGPLKGIWRAFTIHCLNNDHYDSTLQPWRGYLQYQRLLYLASFVATPMRLTVTWTGELYWVMFAADGFTVSYAEPQSSGAEEGPEYDVSLSLIEVDND